MSDPLSLRNHKKQSTDLTKHKHNEQKRRLNTNESIILWLYMPYCWYSAGYRGISTLNFQLASKYFLKLADSDGITDSVIFI